jgi:outer membrane protein assembly factor BamB
MERGAVSGERLQWTEPVAVIDLDSRSPPDGARPTRPHRRAAALVACVVLAFGLPAASGSPPGPGLRLVATVSVPSGGGTIAVEGDLVLLDNGDGRISAFELATGRPRWTVPGVGVIPYPTSGPVLMYDLETPAGRPVTRVVRADTGAVIWSTEGPINVAAEGRIVWTTVTAPASVNAVERPLGSPVGIEVRERASGHLLWSTRPEWTTISEDASGALVLVRAGGGVEARDPLTGAMLRTGQLPRDINPTSMLAVGTSLVVTDYREHRVIGLDPATFQTRWSRAAEGIVPCGDVVCLVDSVGGMAAADPTTGEVWWTNRSIHRMQAFGGGIMLGDAAFRPTRIVDAATGDTMVDLTDWDETPWTEADRPLVLSRVWPHRDRTTVAVLAPGSSAPRLLGVLPYTVRGCQAARGRIVCLTDEHQLGVWACATDG